MSNYVYMRHIFLNISQDMNKCLLFPDFSIACWRTLPANISRISPESACTHLAPIFHGIFHSLLADSSRENFPDFSIVCWRTFAANISRIYPKTAGVFSLSIILGGLCSLYTCIHDFSETAGRAGVEASQLPHGQWQWCLIYAGMNTSVHILSDLEILYIIFVNLQFMKKKKIKYINLFKMC